MMDSCKYESNDSGNNVMTWNFIVINSAYRFTKFLQEKPPP